MSSYGVAWLVVAGAGLVSLVGVFMLTRAISSVFLRVLLHALVLALLLVPAPVPGFDGNYAPAFIVATFEGVFKPDGEPAVALRILTLTAALVIAIITLTTILYRRRRARAGAEPAPER